MRKLCKKADVIVPNLTEAALLLDEPYAEGPYDQAYVEKLLKKLASLGSKQIVLTGVHFNENELGSAAYDCKTGSVHYAMAKRVEGYYHGTGDVFGSALLAALLNGRGLDRAQEIAVEFTVGSILRTKAAGTDIRYGVNFEAGLADLARLAAADAPS
jgi:pyridoxine kinase